MLPNTQPSADSPTKKNGRPLVLDPAKRAEVLAILGLGCNQTVAAEYVGCSISTIYRTARRYPDFAHRLGQARNQAEISLLKKIHNASNDPKYWRAAAWALERSVPRKFAPDGNDAVQPLPSDQLILVITHFARAIIQKVPVDKYRKDIIKTVETMVRDLGQTIPHPQKLLLETIADLAPPAPENIPAIASHVANEPFRGEKTSKSGRNGRICGETPSIDNVGINSPQPEPSTTALPT
jgi:hypothetical protein